MATFRIHEDLEKENRSAVAANVGISQKLNEKRNANVFGILDNKISKNVARLETKKQPLGGKINDENDYNKHVAGKTVANKVIEAKRTAEAFYVYEDPNSETYYPDDKENQTSLEESITSAASVSSCSIRDPLREIKEGTSTPMSVGECLTPMSIDKSAIDINRLQSPATKSDRDLFFEVKEYQADILEYLKEAETRNRPKHGYMRKQPDLTYQMRTILVDWLVEVCEEYKLQSETLCLAVSYIDRFLSFMSVVRTKLQLVGTAAMFIAAKYEEIYPPDVAEFVYITDDTYTKVQVLRMEQLILKVLSFDLSIPTAVCFVNLYGVMLDFPEKIKHLSTFLCELSMLEADPYLLFVPSKISAAALALSRFMLNLPMWPKQYQEVIGYSLDDIKDIVLNLSQTHTLSTQLSQKAIRDKYKNNKFMDVSSLNPCELDESIIEHIMGQNPASEEQEHLDKTHQENNEDVRKMISRIVV